MTSLVLLGACAAPGQAVAQSASFTRSGSDRIVAAALSDSATVTPAYDPTYGQVTALAGSAAGTGGNAYALHYGHDAYTGKQLTQTLVQTDGSGTGSTLFNAANSYDALGRRIGRTIDGGQLSTTTGSTDYWYGPMPHKPLVVERAIGEGSAAGQARVIYLGDDVLVIEASSNASEPSYPLTDHLGSTRLVLDAAGETAYSVSYGDWGQTTISGEGSAVDVTDLRALFRFQGIEQETFPLSVLDVDDVQALAWLDGIGQYHYHGREYAAGLASFLAMDPAGASVSRYSAFAGSPANFVDPDGMAPAKPNGKSGAPLARDSLEGLIAYLRKLGIEKIVMAELHAQMAYQQLYNEEIVMRLLEGAAFGGMPLKFWNEGNGIDDDTFKAYKLLPRLNQDQKKRIATHFVTNTLSVGHVPGYAEKNRAYTDRSAQILLDSNMQVEWLAFDRSTRTDLTDFINYQGFAIARMGMVHALAINVPQNMGYWTGFPWNVEAGRLKDAMDTPKDMQHSPYTVFEQLWKGWWRLQDAAEKNNVTSTAALILPGTVFSEPSFIHNRTQIQQHLAADSTVFEFPLNATASNGQDGYNVTIVVDRAFRAPIWQYIRNMTFPGAVNFNCTGLPGCPAPGKEEL